MAERIASNALLSSTLLSLSSPQSCYDNHVSVIVLNISDIPIFLSPTVYIRLFNIPLRTTLRTLKFHYHFHLLLLPQSLQDIEVVINYDFPVGSGGLENYVHRIGRTARGNATGQAYTFFTAVDASRAKELIDLLTRSQQVR